MNMLRRSPRPRRQGGVIMESALIYPISFFLLFALMVGGMGIFRYQEVAHLARECARFASTHGGTYAKENASAIAAKTLPTVDEQYLKDLVANNSVSLDKTKLSVQVNISTNTGTYDWDDTSDTKNRSPTSSTVKNNAQVTMQNTVSVTVGYQWMPELYLVGPITLQSTAVMPMSY
jgi:Flp pilus assembly protein TadG